MIKKEIIVQRHLSSTREVAQCVQAAVQYRSSLFIERESCKINLKSMMGILCLNLVPEMRVTIIGVGEDENEAVARLEKYLS